MVYWVVLREFETGRLLNYWTCRAFARKMARPAQFRGRLDLSEQSFQPHTVFSFASLRRLPHARFPSA